MFGFLDVMIPIITINGKRLYKICSLSEYDMIRAAVGADNDGEIIRAYLLVLKPLCGGKKKDDIPFLEIKRIIGKYLEEIEKITEECGKLLKVPDSVTMHGTLPNCDLPCHTVGEKIVSDYAGMSMKEVRDMQYLEYRYLLAEAVKYNLSGTKKGIEMLNQCYDEMFIPFSKADFFGR